MKDIQKILAGFALSCLFGIIVSCNTMNMPMLPSSTVTSTLTAEIQPAITSSLTISPSPSPTNPPTLTVSPSPSPISPPTLTLVPTLSPNEIDYAVQVLIARNGDCTLPCWWGIIPGETTWAEAENFLLQYNPTIISDIAKTAREDKKLDAEDYGVSIMRNGPLRSAGASIIVFNKTVTEIYVGERTTGDLFQLRNLLTVYGKPDEVFVKTYSNIPSTIYPFYLVLYYPSQRFAVVYDLQATKNEEKIVGCPQLKAPKLWAWSPDDSEYVDAENVQTWVMGAGNSAKFISVEEAVGMDIETFYKTFKEPTSLCLETQASLWP